MNATNPGCPYCGLLHAGTCSRVKAIEYYQDGTVKRVEFHAPAQFLNLGPMSAAASSGGMTHLPIFGDGGIPVK